MQQQHAQSSSTLLPQLPDTIPDFGGAFGPGRPFCLSGQNDSSLQMGLSPQPPSTGLCLDPLICGPGGPYLFHQTPSGSTLCQLGPAPSGGGIVDPSQCSPTSSSHSGSQTRLIHISGGGGANDSGLSSLSGGFGCPAANTALLHQQHHQHNFSPEVRGELEELEPVPRDRCNTWPLRRAMGLLEGQAQTSPLIHDRIPEEESMYEEEEEELENGAMMMEHHQQRMSSGTDSSGTLAGGGDQSPAQMMGGQGGQHEELPGGLLLEEDRADSAIDSPRADSPTGSIAAATSASKKASTRRNAWGNLSYADLITQAILASPEKRLTLSQVYEWMVQNVPYFRDKGDSNSSAGWKNSIRHNLSLHSRFMRIQNEGAGKSSWWVINPDAKPGRNPRRRANTMENASKAAMEKKRRGARKRVEQLVQQKGQPGSMAAASMQGLFVPAEEEGAAQEGGGGEMASGSSSSGGPGGNFDTFRPRAQSTLSITGPSRLSPKLEPLGGFEDFDFPPWMDQSGGGQPQPVNPQVNELLDRTDQMRLDGSQRQQAMNGSNKMERPVDGGGGGPMLVPKTEMEMAPSRNAKLEQQPPATTSGGGGTIVPPPSYQELSAVRRPVQLQSNPLLRQLGSSPQMMSPLKLNATSSLSGPPPPLLAQVPTSIFTTVPQQFGGFQQWNGVPPVSSGGGPLLMAHPQQQQQQFIGTNGGGTMRASPLGGATALPLDLENVNAIDQSLLTDLDVDALLRHELAQGGQFDLP